MLAGIAADNSSTSLHVEADWHLVTNSLQLARNMSATWVATAMHSTQLAATASASSTQDHLEEIDNCLATSSCGYLQQLNALVRQ